MLPFSCILGNERKFYDFVSSLDAMAEKYAESGITLAYHHHNWEYIKLSNGRSRMEELLGRTKIIKFVHDTYWTARCGISPALQISEFGDRLLGVHMRDLTFKKKGLRVIPTDATIGDGVINFTDVLSAIKSIGCYAVIEQNSKNPYCDIEKSFNRLKAINLSLEDKE